MSSNYLAKAFISCSLRKEDRKFVNLVVNLLHYYHIKPFGTVGLYQASSENPTDLMKKNIEESDFVVIIATKRYFSVDSQSGKDVNMTSEMIHAESGMAFAFSKPVVVFVQEGTDIGNFLPNITQYITLDGTQKNYDSQSTLITSLLNSAIEKVEEKKRRDMWNGLGKIFIGGLAVFGGLALLDPGYDDDDNL